MVHHVDQYGDDVEVKPGSRYLEVWSRKVGESAGYGLHLYVLFRTADGHLWDFSGGPQPAFDPHWAVNDRVENHGVILHHGFIWVAMRRFEVGSYDFKGWDPHRLSRVQVKQDVRGKLSNLARAITARRIAYKVPGPNSNSVVYTACRYLGFGMGIRVNHLRVPGWGIDLLADHTLETQPRLLPDSAYLA